jgi:hypothetical protein
MNATLTVNVITDNFVDIRRLGAGESCRFLYMSFASPQASNEPI